ncbi:MAG: hypothetical protein V4730_00280 [Pseudomonadota bacterium]
MNATHHNKVAQITLLFWVMKICATTLGETAGDLLSMTLNIGYGMSTLLLMSCFLLSLLAQLRARAFNPTLYWTVILTTSTAGTTLSDFMDRTLGLGYAKGSLILATSLALVLAAWRYREKTLSVSHIASTRVELFYWAAILCSNTLGTALGDFLADDSGLGFLGGAALIAGLIAVIVVARFFTRISPIFLFWAAFVLTRPFGATFGDLLTKPSAKGGLDLGTIGSSAVLASILVGLVIYTVVERQPKQASPV